MKQFPNEMLNFLTCLFFNYIVSSIRVFSVITKCGDPNSGRTVPGQIKAFFFFFSYRIDLNFQCLLPNMNHTA